MNFDLLTMPEFDTLSLLEFDVLVLGDISISIRLDVVFTKNYEIDDKLGYRIRIDASEGLNINDEVFGYQQKPDGDQQFYGVCSWVDLVELPQDDPEENTSPAALRLSYVDLVVSSQTVAEEIWALIEADVQELVDTIKDGQTLETQSPVRLAAQ